MTYVFIVYSKRVTSGPLVLAVAEETLRCLVCLSVCVSRVLVALEGFSLRIGATAALLPETRGGSGFRYPQAVVVSLVLH